MDLLNTGDLIDQVQIRVEQRVGLGTDVEAVVDGIGDRHAIALPDDIVGSQGAKVFADGLFGIVIGESCFRWLRHWRAVRVR